MAIDIKDAFHNVPIGADKAFTAAAFEHNGQLRILVYDVLVFGCMSSPTVWGRFAALLGRSHAAINPAVRGQVYVDDPLFTFDSNNPEHRRLLGVSLLWAYVAGFPIKLEKTSSGSEVKWIGALLKVDPDAKAIIVTISGDKVGELCDRITQLLSRPVVGRRQLQSLTGALSFVAGLVPLMRPFLSSLWSALATTNDGPSARCVVHTRRIEPALEWTRHLLGGKAVPFVRIVRAFRPNTGAIVITDASTWGLGGILIVQGTIAEFFSCPIPPEFVLRTHALPGLPKHMALWESLCLLIAARLWLVQFPLGAIVRVKADNIAALHLLARGKGSGPELSMVAREIALDQARGLYEFTLLEHLNTKLNKTCRPPQQTTRP